MTRRTVLIAALVLLAAAAAFAFRVSSNMVDFEVYWRGAVRAAAAEPLYRAGDGHYLFKYLPAFAVLTIPIGYLPLSVAKAAWFAGSIALLLLVVWTSVTLVPEKRKPAAFLVVSVIVVLGKFFARELTLGQVNVLFAALAVSAMVAMRSGRETRAGVLLAFTIAIKPYGVLFFPWLMARRRAASITAAFATSAAIVLLPVVVYGVTDAVALYRAWWATVQDSTSSNLLNPDNVSFASMWAKWLGLGPRATALAVVTGVGALAAAAMVIVRRGGIVFPEAIEGSMLLMLVPLLSPQGWDYVLLLAAPAVALIANYQDRLPAAVRIGTIAAALTIGLSVFDLMGRQAYAAFMGLAVITVCASVLIVALCAMRLAKIA